MTVRKIPTLDSGNLIFDKFMPARLGAASLSSAFVGKSAFSIDIRDFGAKMDGTSDDTAAWNAAIANANAQQPTPVDANNVKGVTILVPAGRTVITAALNPITRSGVNVVGVSENASVILISAPAATFTWGTVASQTVVGGGMANLKIEYLAAPTTASSVIVASNATRLTFSNMLLANVGTLMTLGTSSAMFASAIWVTSLGGYMANIGSPLILAQFGAGLHVDDCKFFVGGVVAPAANRTSTMSTLPGTNGVSLGAGSWDTVHITGSFFERFYRGLSVITANGVIVNNVFISNTYFDYIRQDCIWLQALGTTSGGIFGFNISNSWFAAWEGDGISLNGPGTLRGFSIDSCRMVSAGTHSIKTAPTAREITIHGCQISGSNRTNVNAMGVAIFGGSHVTVTDNISGYDSSWSGFAWQPYAGISMLADLDFIQVRGNDASGVAMAFDMPTNTVGSKNRVVTSNIGANYAGVKTTPVPASGVETTNLTAHVWDMHVHGGTVTAIAKNATAIGGMVSGHLTLAPGETFTITYSVAPSLTTFYRA